MNHNNGVGWKLPRMPSHSSRNLLLVGEVGSYYIQMLLKLVIELFTVIVNFENLIFN